MSALRSRVVAVDVTITDTTLVPEPGGTLGGADPSVP
jgi:hypothetical protein